MMVEVLGTVLGTAIQGQIVGGSSVCAESDAPDSRNMLTHNATSVSLEDTVSVLHHVRHMATNW